MAIKIGIANRKGGIGKSTTTLALAADLKSRGFRVLTIDTDPQRNTTNVFQAETDGVATLYDLIFSADVTAAQCIQHTEYGDIIASDQNLQLADTEIKPSPKMYKYIQKGIAQIEDNYDFILCDTQPHAGILLGNVLMACEYVITPVTCDAFGIQGIMDFYETIKEYQEENSNLKILGLLIIKYKGKQNLTKEVEDQLLPSYAKEMNTKVFSTRIRESVKCQEAQTLRMSIFDYAPSCTTAIDYKELTEEILNDLNIEGK
ncbi:ParA family protein [Succinivibrio dextrinosolvens]|uniref:ParA family protein n=1 Tax=Succinivibrio dextrinosolvens TaxID=83771 RepID=UPI00241F438A|nr:ParA family protein [Succinivibrio dextrinosolvens]MBE6422851.1 ParA family protein [Succinivibrio dextrinosolvens]